MHNTFLTGWMPATSHTGQVVPCQVTPSTSSPPKVRAALASLGLRPVGVATNHQTHPQSRPAPDESGPVTLVSPIEGSVIHASPLSATNQMAELVDLTDGLSKVHMAATTPPANTSAVSNVPYSSLAGALTLKRRSESMECPPTSEGDAESHKRPRLEDEPVETFDAALPIIQRLSSALPADENMVSSAEIKSEEQQLVPIEECVEAIFDEDDVVEDQVSCSLCW